jgi:hypothetical protein
MTTKKGVVKKYNALLTFWPMAYSLVCDSVVKLLIQAKYDKKPEI